MPTLFSKPKQPSAAPATGGAAGAPGGAGGAKLFNPEQVAKATKDYTAAGGAKWNQIMSNMGAGGGIGGPDFSKAIESQAQTMGAKLGELTGESGYGNDPGQVAQIMKQLEGGIGAQYPVY
jgi:hypothetical protein